VHQVAVDQDNTMLVWTGSAAAPLPAATDVHWCRHAHRTQPADLYASPSHRQDSGRPPWKAKRKQVTVLFIDLKDSTELIAALIPKPRSNSWTPPSSA